MARSQNRERDPQCPLRSRGTNSADSRYSLPTTGRGHYKTDRPSGGPEYQEITDVSDFLKKWRATLAVSACGITVWVVAARNGYGWEMLWLPAVLTAAAWPRTTTGFALSSWRTKDGTG